MRPLITLAFAFLFALPTFGQTEDYSKTLLKLPWGSGKLTAYMQFEPLHTFHLAGNKVQDWGRFYNEDSTKSVHIESLIIVDESQSVYIQLMYADDKLYAKNINWYFNEHDVEGVQHKYTMLNGAVVGNPYMQSVTHGPVRGNEYEYETGKITRYQGPEEAHQIYVINTGYEVVSDIYGDADGTDAINGFYVFAELIYTKECPLDETIKHPTPEILNVSINDIDKQFQ